MQLTELLDRFVQAAEHLDVPYFVTGSVASSYYGEARFTNDIDIVIEISPQRVVKLCEAFDSDEFYVDSDAARSAAAHFGMFNIIVSGGLLKIDVVIAQDTPLNRSRFARARKVKLSSRTEAFISSAEDVILSKLLFYKEGRSEKHTRDIATILKTRWEQLDLVYIAGWSLRLGVETIWRDILVSIGRLDAYGIEDP